MKLLITFVVGLLAINASAFAQKKILSNGEDNLANWSSIDGAGISNDGKYIHYLIAWRPDSPLIIITRNTKKADTVLGVMGTVTYSKDSRYLIFRMRGDSLVKYDLAKKKISFIANVADWKLVGSGADEFLLMNKNGQQLQIDNMITNKSLTVDGVKYYVTSSDTSSLAVVHNNGLSLVSFSDLKQQLISKLTSVSGLAFDPSANKFFFYAQEEVKTAYMYDRNTKQLRKLLDETSEKITDGYKLGSAAPQFTPDGRNLIFIFQKKEEVLADAQYGAMPQMEIWNHKEIWHTKSFIHYDRSIAVLKLDDPALNLKTIVSGFVELLKAVSDPDKQKKNSFLFVVKRVEADDRLYYNSDRMPDFLLYSIQDEQFAPFVPKSHYVQGSQIAFSPTARFASWYDRKSNDYYCYDVVTNKMVNTTIKIDVPADMVRQADNSPSSKLTYGFLDWLADDKWFMIRDKYDLWQVDPTGKADPINLTGGYGRKNQIQFRNILEEVRSKELKDGTKLVITAMDEDKNNGFGSIVLGSNKGLQMAGLEGRLFYWTDSETGHGSRVFIRAKLSDDYLVTAQRADESPNLYVTRDFKKYTKLSDVHPEKEYNWLTSTLVKYPMQGGKTGQCILYKPENFDPQKKYPVLFTYYQKRNHNLHSFPDPIPDVNISIACYVSNGYIVVVPDIINDEPGKIAQTTVNSVKSAADYLKQFSWFDYSKMGIQGQSFGGYETNLLVTNTNIFAAAQASDAPSSQTSFGQFFEAGSHTFIERGQPNLGVTLWENPAVYIENSPIYKANKVTTPLLLLHGRKDKAVDFNQAEAMYYSLKRLNKPVWMIIYDGADHATFGEGNGRLDFNIRRQQFFDHYLKGAPIPLWMKEETLSLSLDLVNKRQ